MTTYTLTEADKVYLDRAFRYHTPKDGQTERYGRIREQAHDLAELLLTTTPPSRERSLALTKLEEAMFWANAGLARNE